MAVRRGIGYLFQSGRASTRGVSAGALRSAAPRANSLGQRRGAPALLAAAPARCFGYRVGQFDSITEDEFVAHHITASPEDMKGNGSAGRFFLVPGSSGRAEAISNRYLRNVTTKGGERGHTVFLGDLDTGDETEEKGVIKVGVVSTGMGCPSVDIILTELIKMGCKRMIRVGSCGSLQPKTIRVGSVAIGTSGVKDESTSSNYAPVEFPSVAARQMVEAMVAASLRLGLGDLTFAGPIHSKDSLYAREFKAGPLGQEHVDYMAKLDALGAIASEMEASLMFTLGSVYSPPTASVAAQAAGTSGEVMMGAVCGVIGDDSPFADPEEQARAVDRAIDIAIQGIREMAASG